MDSIYATLDQSQSSRLSHSLPTSEMDQHPGLDGKELALWRWANVTNIDAFLSDVYEFYLDKGFYCLLLKRALNMLTVMFVVVFSTYLTNCIDFHRLQGAKTLEDIRVEHCLAKSSFLTKLWLWIFGVLWLLRLFQYISDIPHLLELKAFYEYLLDINDNELQTISWQQVVIRLVHLQDVNFKANDGGTVLLDPHNIANRIMRKENYMITLYSKDVLDLDIDLPIFGKTQFLTKTLEWSINLCILDFVFNNQGTIRSVFLDETKRAMLSRGLERRFRFVAIMNIVLAPFAILYMSLYYFFKYFNEYHKDPSTMGMRQFTPLAEWKMRELNELYHMFKRRLSMSTIPAGRYISQFPREKMDAFLRFVVFIFSSFAAVLGIASIYDPELLSLELGPDKSVLFLIGIFGTIIAVARGMSENETAIYEPETAMRQIIEFTHYFPDSWQGELHTERVKTEFCSMYDLKIKVLLRDFLSIFLNPLLLWYNLPDSCDKIIDFFRESSVKVDGLGYVCSFAVFNYDQAQKVKARADELDRYYASNDGKMLKSYLNFMDAYGPESSRIPPISPVEHSSPTREYVLSPTREHLGQSDLFGQSSIVPGQMGQSVMGQYNRLRRLSSVQEEDNGNTTSTGTSAGNKSNVAAFESPNSSAGDLLNLLQEAGTNGQSPEIDSNGGVFGLLNKISKAEGRRGPLRQ